MTERGILAMHIQQQSDWSHRTFGPGARTGGITKHIAKELDEIRDDPYDLKEWIDVLILALDGAWRSGASPDEIIAAYHDKMTENIERTWPDWRDGSEDEPIEHVRT